MQLSTRIKQLSLLILVLVLSACAQTYPFFGYSRSGINTMLSSPIAVFQNSAAKRTVYLQIVDKTHASKIEVKKARLWIIQGLKARDYQVVSKRTHAHYKLLVTFLQLKTMTRFESLSILTQGYGGAVALPGASVLDQKKVHKLHPSDWQGLADTLVADVVVSYYSPDISNAKSKQYFKTVAGNVYYYTRILSWTKADHFKNLNQATPALTWVLANRIITIF
jgi:hypothetical protein